MRWTAKKKAVLISVSIPVLLFVSDLCRVQLSLSGIISRAELGMTLGTAEDVLGKATSRGSWSGSYGSGMRLVYRRPYVWEHVPASLPTRIGFHPFWVEFSDRWYVRNSPAVELAFDEQGRLAEVTERGFASRCCEVVKSTRH